MSTMGMSFILELFILQRNRKRAGLSSDCTRDCTRVIFSPPTVQPAHPRTFSVAPPINALNAGSATLENLWYCI